MIFVEKEEVNKVITNVPFLTCLDILNIPYTFDSYDPNSITGSADITSSIPSNLSLENIVVSRVVVQDYYICCIILSNEYQKDQLLSIIEKISKLGAFI